MALDMRDTSVGTLKMRLSVLLSCRTVPFSVSFTASAFGSEISSFVTSHGPMGQNVS